MIKVGVAGIGRVAEDTHIPSIRKIKEFKLVSAYDPVAARRKFGKEKHNIDIFSDYDSFIDSGLDLIVIAAPSCFHTELSLKAIGKVKGIIIEKPIALTAKEADKIIKKAGRHGAFLSVHQNRRWDADYLTVKKVVDEGALGKLYTVESKCSTFGSLIGYAVKEFDTAWRYKKCYGGGLLYDFGTHLIDQVLCMTKPRKIVSVWCNTKAVMWSKEVEDYFKLLVRFDDGLVAEIETSQVSCYPLPRWFILGNKGCLKCEDWNEPVKVTTVSDGNREKEILPKMASEEWYKFYENVRDCLVSGAKPLVRLEEVRRSAAVVDAARRSAHLKHEIKVKL